jgi:hypothetical protein
MEHECFTVETTAYLRNLSSEDRRSKTFAVLHQKPPVRNEEAKVTSFGLRFPVLIVANHIEDQQAVAEKVARILNAHWEDEA